MSRHGDVAAQTDCPACEEGYICRQGEGCLLVEVFGDEQPAAWPPLRDRQYLIAAGGYWTKDGVERLLDALRLVATDEKFPRSPAMQRDRLRRFAREALEGKVPRV